MLSRCACFSGTDELLKRAAHAKGQTTQPSWRLPMVSKKGDLRIPGACGKHGRERKMASRHA